MTWLRASQMQWLVTQRQREKGKCERERQTERQTETDRDNCSTSARKTLLVAVKCFCQWWIPSRIGEDRRGISFCLFVCLFVFRGIYKNWRLNWLTGPLLLNRFTSSVINEGNTKFGNKIPLECLVVFLSVVVFFSFFFFIVIIIFLKNVR